MYSKNITRLEDIKFLLDEEDQVKFNRMLVNALSAIVPENLWDHGIEAAKDSFIETRGIA
jgi:hypothetical protein